MPTFPFTAGLSGESIVTASQYNQLMSAILVMPLPMTATATVGSGLTGSGMSMQASALPSNQFWYFPRSGMDANRTQQVVKDPVVIFGAIANRNQNVSAGLALIRWYGNVLAFNTGSANAFWSNAAPTGEGPTNGSNTPAPGGTAISGSSTNMPSAVWDMGAVYTGQMVVGFRATVNGAARTASAKIQISGAGGGWTDLFACADRIGGSFTYGISEITAGRYIRELAWIVAPANTTAYIQFALTFFTASAVVTAAESSFRSIALSALPNSGEIVALVQSAGYNLTGFWWGMHPVVWDLG